jgi:hypothetical protein
VHLTLTDDNGAEIDALADLLGGRVGLAGVLDRLDRQARPSRLGRLSGRLVDAAYGWEREDARDHRWWPQGISSSADADPSERVLGRRLLLVSWYAHPVGGASHGTRLTVLDLDSLRYRHVLLVVPRLTRDGTVTVGPLTVHAGGIAWLGGAVHVAATARGLVTCHLDDVVRAGPGVESHGHDLLLPVRSSYRAGTEEGHERLRYSFVSLDRTDTAGPPVLVAGEYGRRRGATTRLARFGVDAASSLLATGDDGRARPTTVEDGARARMQGAARVDGTWHATVSMGPWLPGGLASGAPGRLRLQPLALPMGPEDLTWWPSTRRLWSVSEHPGRRWIFSFPRPGAATTRATGNK